MAARSERSRFGAWAPIVGLIAVASVLATGIGLIWLASESHYRGCVARVDAAFPAVPVSAFARSKTATGPLKVSFVKERTKALKGCHHF